MKNSNDILDIVVSVLEGFNRNEFDACTALEAIAGAFDNSEWDVDSRKPGDGAEGNA